MAAIPQEFKGISQMLEDMRSQNPIERIGRKLQLIFIKITYLIVIIKMKMLSDRKVDRDICMSDLSGKYTCRA